MALAHTLRSMGHAVEGVFGIDVAGPAAHREALFYDRLARPARRPKGLKRWLSATRLATGAASFRVSSGGVDARSLAHRLPHFDALWSSPDLFERAQDYFRLTGRFTELQIASPPDIMHWTYPVPVRVKGARNIYTLHDLVPLRLPFATLDEKRLYRALVGTCVAQGDHICTVSEASRADIIELLHADPGKVSNTYQVSTIDPAVIAEDAAVSAETISALFGLAPQGYYLFYGAIEPKKNLGRLIEAYLSLRLKAPLVIVAAKSWQSSAEVVLLPREDDPSGLRHEHLRDRVVQIDYLPRHLLLRLLRGARALVFPSLYEGFGLPVLEAMSLGVPVLSSTTAAIREIAGEAAILVDPYVVAEIADALARVDADAALRQSLATRGIARAAAFSESAYQRALAEMYSKVLGETS
ncbi:glycosyltransferase involved in cell wall biosynthesis [Sphingomonas trueperi]